MKKVYEKPQVYAEQFAMSQSIASCVGVGGGGSTLGKPTHWDKTTCGWDVGGVIVWAQEGICDDIAGEDEEVNGVCYNNPSGSVVAFSS